MSYEARRLLSGNKNLSFTMTHCRHAWLAVLLAFSTFSQAHGQELVELSLRIPMPEAGKNGLEAVMVRPNDSAAHPLALLSHGTPRDAQQRPGMTAWGLVPQAREFARRGWTTVVALRRGYGSSGGGYEEDGRGCSSHPNYYGAGKESAKDLRAAISYLSSRPEVDATRIIGVGISAGGFATVALTADPPAGLVAAISFAGGRGSNKPDNVCNPGDLVRAFAEFGAKSRIPMLWVYAENDHFFGPQLAEQFHQAFVKSGGTVSFIRAAAFRNDGHGLFSYAGIPMWTSMVDDFLAAQNLQLRDALLALPAAPDVSPPSQLSAAGRQVFRYFLTLPPKRAFAVSSSGHYGYAFGRRTEKEATTSAEEHCKDETPKAERCEVLPSAAGSAQ
jgi:dienelactone hydrolase